MLPRTLIAVSRRVRTRPFPAHDGLSLGVDIQFPPARCDGSALSLRHCRAIMTGASCIEAQVHHRCFSAEAAPGAPPPDPDFAAGHPPPHNESNANIRLESSPASTPANVGCTAYYTARNIDVDSACKKLYAAYPRSYEKHCVVVGPLDPTCFDGFSSRRGADTGGSVMVLPGVPMWMRPKSTATSSSRSRRRQVEEPARRSTPGVIFADEHPSFLAGGYGSRAQGWEMWDPAGEPRPRQRKGGKLAGPEDSGLSYVVMFDYGSVVFLHFTEQQMEAHLKQLREHVKEPDLIHRLRMKTETHDVVLWSSLPEPARLEPDCTTLRELDVNLITIIGTVLAQTDFILKLKTVALDHYADLVDTMMARFASINSGVEQTGRFTSAQRKELFQLVARNNTVSTDVVSKLGILERSEAAWKDKDYNFVWEGLREEFEMDNRFRNIEFKLNMLQQNTNFFIEMLHNQKSTMLEWTIIVLISAEIFVGVCDLMKFQPFS